ncbi:glycosyltransferase family 2 protein [Candidatus Venteria ishoeyi]|uniref:Putative glycosyltransferase EpsH n=1 Tax=Candidatus Venteria ishoeyi TaxID=1899563 RepID=A0A1H6FAM3_9GAMM|nr:glycosyltransferase [Candidatus Venteria ishoeyi]SEH07138.1 Putative glycosyltransferase EpsH [Candidatus Venteria ishoeyi]
MNTIKHISAINASSTPVCSICIANYNGINLLKGCLDAIRLQDCEFEFEIILHDDASTDESVHFVKTNYPEVEILVSQENVGFCVSNNRMAEIAKGEFILLLNNDAELFPDSLDTLYQYACQQKQAGILTLAQYDRATSQYIDFGSDLDIFLNPVPRHAYQDNNVATAYGACMWMPKQLWQKMEGFPEWFESVGEDLYLSVLAQYLGYSVEVPQHSGYWHWAGKSFGGGKLQNNKLVTTYKRRALSERNKTYVMLLLYPWYTFPLWILHCILLLVEGLVLSLILRNYTIWHQIYAKTCNEVILQIKQIYQERRALHCKYQLNSKKFFKRVSWFPYKLRLLLKYGIPHIK